ncbi:hypothetical protein FB446DRAFT_799324 [Lentinula raphanica]|uniref:Uncharacterized protein n=1 Tax=Lentinula raphanica TaxID=153919 RepID=A0AA38PH62_9AGAR|nr:hypothetical protein EV360DRAFT_71536 [Lentinula raphanica]KAJ3772578.1 hypothetical protein FB446DRAFT_799324 [Lentinula raphanica]KAJ3842560.1 hypothetical protein F5878DRAFT_384120 [Lentinula raphanica]
MVYPFFSAKSPLSLSLFFVLLLMLLATRAQMPPDENLFQWKFSNNFLGTQLPSCQSLGIIVEPVNATNITHGVPPFYMIAWEMGGTPRTTLLGLNESSLSWTVDHPVGTSLMLNVVDSQGNGGGIPPQAYTVEAGQSTECVVDNDQRDFIVTANVSGTINTCQPYGLRISGGSPPYNISLAQFDSPVVTNVTIPSPLDAFTYINRATPEYTLLVAVSDITGRYAFGTPTIMPTGSEDVTCAGLNSSPGNATWLTEAQDAQLHSITEAKHRKTAILVGTILPLSVLLIGIVAYLLYRAHHRQQKLEERLKPEPLTLPEPKAVEEAEANSSVGTGVILENQALTASPVSDPDLNLNPFLTQAERSITALNDNIIYPSSTRIYSGRSSRTSSTHSGFVNFPTTSVRGASKKSIQAKLESLDPDTQASSNSSRARNPPVVGRSLSAQPRGSPIPTLPMRSSSFGAPTVSPIEGEYVFQHQDGGRFIRELPPPYERRSRPNPDVLQFP